MGINEEKPPTGAKNHKCSVSISAVLSQEMPSSFDPASRMALIWSDLSSFTLGFSESFQFKEGKSTGPRSGPSRKGEAGTSGNREETAANCRICCPFVSMIVFRGLVVASFWTTCGDGKRRIDRFTIVYASYSEIPCVKRSYKCVNFMKIIRNWNKGITHHTRGTSSWDGMEVLLRQTPIGNRQSASQP